MLLQLLEELTGEVQDMQDEALKGEQDFSVDHMADHGSDNYEQDFTLSRIERDGQTIYSIRLALQKVEDGSYGACDHCSKAIPEARLRAIPYALRCIPCQEAYERGEFDDHDG